VQANKAVAGPDSQGNGDPATRPAGASGDGDKAQPGGYDPGSSEQKSSSGSPKANRGAGQRMFISYVATHPDSDEEGDADGLDHAERLALEKGAIELIRAREPVLKVMPAGNKGYDLIETDANDEPERWVEVKAMKGSLDNRPVGLSSVQFEFARQHGEQYWLYVVEYAGDLRRARIVQNQQSGWARGYLHLQQGLDGHRGSR
jgi:Domain of unknown function (DUF3883)